MTLLFGEVKSHKEYINENGNKVVVEERVTRGAKALEIEEKIQDDLDHPLYINFVGHNITSYSLEEKFLYIGTDKGVVHRLNRIDLKKRGGINLERVKDTTKKEIYLYQRISDISAFKENLLILSGVKEKRLYYYDSAPMPIELNIKDKKISDIKKLFLLNQDIALFIFKDGYLYMYDLKNKKSVYKIKTIEDIKYISLTHSNRYLLAASNSKAILIDVPKSRVISKFDMNSIKSIKMTEDFILFLTDKKIELFKYVKNKSFSIGVSDKIRDAIFIDGVNKYVFIDKERLFVRSLGKDDTKSYRSSYEDYQKVINSNNKVYIITDKRVLNYRIN